MGLGAWLFPVAVLGGAAGLVFVVTTTLDAVRSGMGWHALRAIYEVDAEMAWNTLGNLAQVVAAILGIAITVVSIVVELAANRYTPRITELFIRAPVNFVVLGFFLVSCLVCVWVSVAVHAEFVPQIGIAVTVVLLSASLLLLIPYFAYVFRFLAPRRIVQRLVRDAAEAMSGAARDGEEAVDAAKERVVEEVEQLADVALNAIHNADKAIAMDAVRALSDLLVSHAAVKPSLGARWFALGPALGSNPDFVSMDPEVLADLERSRLWLEMKVLRQYQTLYSEALGRQREISHMIAIQTRRLAEQALAAEDQDVLDLAIKYFNTYLRATINARDVRTGFNVLHQYRFLGEAALRGGSAPTTLAVARFFAYYGQAAFSSGLPFLLETVAYDLCALNECAFDAGAPAELRDALLGLFLQVDKESEAVHEHEASLRGVRKAQVKLATFYLARGQEAPARRIFADMEREPLHRLRSIRDELAAVVSKYFWEVTDRGLNMDWIPPERRGHLARFFAWFGDRLETAREEEANR
jgi:hypothetical protein